MSDFSSNSGYLVVIEWDGKKPPTPFYHRVRKLTSGVRQDDSEEARKKSPFARRATRNDSAVVMQEGAIYCTSSSLARALALLAEQYGAANVEMADVSDLAPVVATKEDIAALSRINKILGRRGRPPAKRYRNVTITCFEEIRSTTVFTDEELVTCPYCGSLTTELSYPDYAEEYENQRFCYSAKLSIFESWLEVRVFDGSGVKFLKVDFDVEGYDGNPLPFFKAPYSHAYANNESGTEDMFSYDGNSSDLLTRISLLPKPQKRVLLMMSNSNLDYLDNFAKHPDVIVKMLDAIFVSRYKLPSEDKIEGRIAALSAAMLRYPDIGNQYDLAIDDDKVDFFDASPIIPAKELVEYFTMMRSNEARAQQKELLPA